MHLWPKQLKAQFLTLAGLRVLSLLILAWSVGLRHSEWSVLYFILQPEPGSVGDLR